MNIEKIFSNAHGERLFSVLMSKQELDLFQEKLYSGFYNSGPSRYDMTDRLKDMKDNDILAEQARSNSSSYKKVASQTGIGAGIGATLGAIGAGIGKMKGKNVSIKGAMKTGALLGGTVGGSAAYLNTSKQRSDNNFYNNRLQYMQQQSKRREMNDWKNNAVNRVEYTR